MRCRYSTPAGATTNTARGGRVSSEGHGVASDGQDVSRFIEPKLRCVYRYQQWHTSAKTRLPTAPDEGLNEGRGC